MKKLFRSDSNKIVAGIIGGIGEYYEIDPTVLRLIFIILTLVSGVAPGVVFYIIALFIVPKAGAIQN